MVNPLSHRKFLLPIPVGLPIDTPDRCRCTHPGCAPTHPVRSEDAGGGHRTVSRESKVLIGVGALVVIGLILALVGQTTIGVIAVLIGLIVGVVALRVTKTDATDPFAEARTEADLPQHRHPHAGPTRWRRGRPRAGSTPGPRRPIWPHRRLRPTSSRPTTPRPTSPRPRPTSPRPRPTRPRPTRRRASTPRPTTPRPSPPSPPWRPSRPARPPGTTAGTPPSAGPPRPSRPSRAPIRTWPTRTSPTPGRVDTNPLDDLVGLDAPRPHRRGGAHREPRLDVRCAARLPGAVGVGLRRHRHPRHRPSSTSRSARRTTSWPPARPPSSTSGPAMSRPSSRSCWPRCRSVSAPTSSRQRRPVRAEGAG